MFKLGDFVRFIDEKREGYITRIIDAQTLGVTDTDGFEIPVVIANLTHVHGHSANTPTSTSHTQPLIITEDFIENGVYLAVTEDSNASSVVHFTLINSTSYQLLLSLKTNKKGFYKGEFANTIAAKSSTQLYSTNLADLEIWPEFMFQILYFYVGNTKPKAPLNLIKHFKAKDFSGAKKKIIPLGKQGWQIQLDEQTILIDAQKLKESFFTTKTSSSIVLKPANEVDLHIEKLRDDHHFLAQTEMLNIQLNYFQQMLDAAIVHQLSKIIFIHGVGNGTLRHHIHKVVSKHLQVRTFMDAQKDKFGYGATEVVFK